MIVKVKGFRMIPSVNAPVKWDLQKAVVRTKKESKEQYDDWEDCGYGMSMEHCAECIIAEELLDREEEVSLREYIEAYKKERQEILDILK